MEIKTSDLYCASYILSEGGELKSVDVVGRGRQVCAEFTLCGDDVDHLQRIFQSGKAKVDLMNFKTSLTHMKDMMFHTLRKFELERIQSSKPEISCQPNKKRWIYDFQLKNKKLMADS